MRKAIIIGVCILAVYGVIGAQSDAITDCKKMTFCARGTGDNGNCEIEYEYERNQLGRWAWDVLLIAQP